MTARLLTLPEVLALYDEPPATRVLHDGHVVPAGWRFVGLNADFADVYERADSTPSA